MTAERHINPDAKTLGQLAKSAFSNPAFETAVVETADQILREWAATDPGQGTLREQLWLKYQALQDILNDMQGYVVTAENEETLAAATERAA